MIFHEVMVGTNGSKRTSQIGKGSSSSDAFELAINAGGNRKSVHSPGLTAQRLVGNIIGEPYERPKQQHRQPMQAWLDPKPNRAMSSPRLDVSDEAIGDLKKDLSKMISQIRSAVQRSIGNIDNAKKISEVNDSLVKFASESMQVVIKLSASFYEVINHMQVLSKELDALNDQMVNNPMANTVQQLDDKVKTSLQKLHDEFASSVRKIAPYASGEVNALIAQAASSMNVVLKQSRDLNNVVLNR